MSNNNTFQRIKSVAQTLVPKLNLKQLSQAGAVLLLKEILTEKAKEGIKEAVIQIVKSLLDKEKKSTSTDPQKNSAENKETVDNSKRAEEIANEIIRTEKNGGSVEAVLQRHLKK
nr:MAG TPA: hypothetical protein [Caudoviricetes sp.]